MGEIKITIKDCEGNEFVILRNEDRCTMSGLQNDMEISNRFFESMPSLLSTINVIFLKSENISSIEIQRITT